MKQLENYSCLSVGMWKYILPIILTPHISSKGERKKLHGFCFSQGAPNLPQHIPISLYHQTKPFYHPL